MDGEGQVCCFRWSHGEDLDEKGAMCLPWGRVCQEEDPQERSMPVVTDKREGGQCGSTSFLFDQQIEESQPVHGYNFTYESSCL